MSQERRITIDRTTIDDLMPFFVGISKELIAQDRVETDLQDFIDRLGTLQRDIGDFLDQLPDYLEKYKRLQDEKQAINRKIEQQKKEAAELDAKLRAEFGVGQQASVFDTVDVLGMLSTPADKAYREEQNHANALGSNDDDSYWGTGSGNEDALGGRIGAVDDAGRPIDPYMDLDDRLTDEMLRERQDMAAQRSDERAKAVTEKAAAAKALSETQEKGDERDANDLNWAMPSGEQPIGNATGRQQPQQQSSLDDMFGLDDDDDDDLMGFSAPKNQQQTENGQGGSQPYGIGGLDDLGDFDDDDF